jgi:hypothetical protein
MNTSSDAEIPPVDAVKIANDKPQPKPIQSTASSPKRPTNPYLDADPDDLVPGYSQSDAWYEP